MCQSLLSLVTLITVAGSRRRRSSRSPGPDDPVVSLAPVSSSRVQCIVCSSKTILPDVTVYHGMYV